MIVVSRDCVYDAPRMGALRSPCAIGGGIYVRTQTFAFDLICMMLLTGARSGHVILERHKNNHWSLGLIIKNAQKYETIDTAEYMFEILFFIVQCTRRFSLYIDDVLSITLYDYVYNSVFFCSVSVGFVIEFPMM